jgi:hypothetical protein
LGGWVAWIRHPKKVVQLLLIGTFRQVQKVSDQGWEGEFARSGETVFSEAVLCFEGFAGEGFVKQIVNVF